MKGYGVTLRATVPGVSELVQLARETEDDGFSGVYIAEAVKEALMWSLAVANATKRIAIATWIVNIYLREPGLCAIAAEMVQEAAEGRFILGLGTSHRPALEARGIEMGNARDRLRHDTEIIGRAFRGELEMFGRKFPAPSHSIPIYFAALALETAKLGGEMAARLIVYICPPGRVRKSIHPPKQEAKEKSPPPGNPPT